MPTPTKAVRFANNLIRGPTSNNSTKRAPAALRVCNSLLDRYPHEAAIDSAATGHFIDDNYRGGNHQPVTDEEAIDVECANATTMMSSSTDTLDIQKLKQYEEASKCDKFKAMNTSLISVRQLDEEADLAVLFHERKVKVFDPIGMETIIPKEKIIMEGELKPNGLYMTPLHD